MDMLSQFRHFYACTRHFRASHSLGCCSVRSITGSIERAVAPGDCCGDSLPLRLLDGFRRCVVAVNEALVSTLKRWVVLEVLQPHQPDSEAALAAWFDP